MIVVVVALRLSAADVLSRPGAEGNSLIVITSPSSSPAQPQLAKDIEDSLDGRSAPILSANLSIHTEPSWTPEVRK